ncbi:MAG: metallophosphoesterase [Desulfitobacteriaceae bacterium]
MRKKIVIIIPVILLLLISGVFFIYSYNNFKVDEKFSSIPLSFNPYDSTSTYEWNGALIKVQGGFIKGKFGDKNTEELLLRSLSPTPMLTIKSKSDKDSSYLVRLENVNVAKIVINNGTASFSVVDPHTLRINLKLKAAEEKTLVFTSKEPKESSEFVILGDNRNGYQTFSNIIEQINAFSPSFTIDNGDLVFGGEPNKYRLFYETVSKLQIPLYTTLGNHDIRGNGRSIYTNLFGPPYYSFDYLNTHFIFLDSSRGWAEKMTIPEEQYKWLENDLQGAQGKKIFVISHIPSTDPRSQKAPNTLPEIPGVQKTGFFERLMNNYSAYKSLDHAFPDKEEAKRFENMMSNYKVDTVFLSHIHSYFSFLKDGVRYVISGGAGAELLTDNSYYHYLRVKVAPQENLLEIVQLPSPPNNLQDRYLAATQLFASSTYKEYTTTVLTILTIFIVILAWILWHTRKSWWQGLKFLTLWLFDIVKFAKARFKQLRTK